MPQPPEIETVTWAESWSLTLSVMVMPVSPANVQDAVSFLGSTSDCQINLILLQYIQQRQVKKTGDGDTDLVVEVLGGQMSQLR